MNQNSETKNESNRKFSYKHLFAAASGALLIFGPQPGRPVQTQDKSFSISNDGRIFLNKSGDPITLDFSDSTLSKRFTFGSFQITYNSLPLGNLPAQQQDAFKKIRERACDQVRNLQGYSQICIGLKFS